MMLNDIGRWLQTGRGKYSSYDTRRASRGLPTRYRI